MSEDPSPQEANAAPEGAERREHFRVNTTLRVSVDPLGGARSQAWAYSESRRLSPVVQPDKASLKQAAAALKGASRRQVNLSAGGMRIGYRFGEEGGLKADRGMEVGLTLGMTFGDDEGVTIVFLPAWVVWMEQTAKWQYMGFQYARMPTAVERVLSQYVMEVERRRLRPT
jgi:c-di-GMP-binding flagellar brake protein YcgR